MRFCLLFVLGVYTTLAIAENGMISVKSPYPVAETADRLIAVLEEQNMNVFSRIDHAAGAAAVDMELRPTQLVIFGNPRAGTPLMQCSQTVAIDLPQKALIWQDAGGQVWLSYNDPRYLAERHELDACSELVEKIAGALANFATAATAVEESENASQ